MCKHTHIIYIYTYIYIQYTYFESWGFEASSGCRSANDITYYNTIKQDTHK